MVENPTQLNPQLIDELAQLIEQGQQQVVSYANSTLTLLFWQVGKRINQEILQHKRADYGKQIVPAISVQLEARFGRNFSEKNVRRMIQFAEQFGDFEIVVPLARQLSWSHILILLPLKNQEAQIYYAQKVREEHWGKRELRQQIARKAYERKEIDNTKIILCYTTAFPMMTLLTADAVEFRIAPVVRGVRFSGVFGNRGGG